MKQYLIVYKPLYVTLAIAGEIRGVDGNVIYLRPSEGKSYTPIHINSIIQLEVL